MKDDFMRAEIDFSKHKGGLSFYWWQSKILPQYIGFVVFVGALLYLAYGDIFREPKLIAANAAGYPVTASSEFDLYSVHSSKINHEKVPASI